MKRTALVIISFVIITLLYFSDVFSQTKKTKDSLKIEKIAVKKTVIDTIKRDSLTLIKPIVKVKTELLKEKVHASYYADKFHGKKTASGKIFDMNKLTAAHKKLPFGSKVKVTNIANNKSVIVEINDRGPFVKGREIDLSRKAFSLIASTNRGFITVNLEVLKN
jgi:rare lipoprotein A